MTSVASGGRTERIVARILFKVVRAGSGTPARYSSMSLALFFFAALRSAGLADFTEEYLPKVEKKNWLNFYQTLLLFFVAFCEGFLVFIITQSWRLARSTQVLAVLMQHHSDHLAGAIAFEIQLCLHNFVEKLVGRAGINREGRLPTQLRLQLGIL